MNEAVPRVQEYFGQAAKIQGELFRDPDHDDHCEAVARILTRLSSKDAVELLNRFDSD